MGVRLDSVWVALVAANNSKTNQFQNLKEILTCATYYKLQEKYSLGIAS